MGKIDAIVDAQSFAGVIDTHGGNGVPGALEYRDHVGEVVFTGRITGVDPADVPPEKLRAKTINTHVGFADGKLLGVGGFLFDDFLDGKIGVVADDAAVAGRIFHIGAEEGAGGLARHLALDQLAQRFDAQQRRIAVQDHQVAGERLKPFPANHYGVSGTSLFLLFHEADSWMGDGRADFIRLMAHDDEDTVGGGETERGLDHVFDEGATAGVVQHFGLAGLHSGTETRSENHNRKWS